jgi:hypothetical protein
MSERPTEDLLADPAETGRHGCLLPEIEDDQGHCDAASEEEEEED